MKTGYSFGSLVSFTEALNAAAVKITSDQTIAGVKTFSSNPISSAAQGTGGSYLTRKDYVDGALALKAPLASPALTGTPTAPTAAAGTNTAQLATTAFVTASNTAQLATVTPLMNGTATVGASTLVARQDHVHPIDTSRAPLASPTFTGIPAAPTAAAGTNTTQLATTAFVISENTAQLANVDPLMDGTAAVGTSTLLARQDHIHPTDTSRAPLTSPALTGTPTAPTQAVDTNNTTIATTAFVTAAIVAVRSGATPLMNGVADVGTSTQFSREDHVHASDTTKANLASPTFTGVPTAPTASNGTSTTQLATTEFVNSAISIRNTYATLYSKNPGETTVTVKIPTGYRSITVVMCETSSTQCAAGDIPYPLMTMFASRYLSIDYGDSADWGVTYTLTGTSLKLVAGNRGAIYGVYANR